MNDNQVRISLGLKLRGGPWGGSNQFGQSLSKFMVEQGYKVSFDLDDPRLDLIMLIDPRSRGMAAYNERSIFRYLKSTNPRALVVHRVNECDERKGTNYVNGLLSRANMCADHTVYVSSWLKDLHEKRGMPCKSSSVILNGSDSNIFLKDNYVPWQGNSPLKLVTHHWGNNWNKGFDIYSLLDQRLADADFRKKFEFSYIGRVPEGFEFQNSRHIEPQSGRKLAELIGEHHVYITATINEPGSNHQNEGALCGLPILFRESGCLPEYCDGYGVSYNLDNFFQQLDKMAADYEQWLPKMNGYPHSAEKMSENYIALFGSLLGRRDKILHNRDIFKRKKWFVKKLWHKLSGFDRRTG